ncbi:lysis system i-spanin subunit Rz [Comamonas kerstersii]|uniref:lysis system i-spanin subunit Rz n=1 Tax=Comamonas kerstersii TaxID=225992 RepID=UPI001B3420F7|nr:lysis system i-spanin subunit Rz [Comamonas kerstersii]QTW18073.1 lysis protein [Comamonas kerstersii]
MTTKLKMIWAAVLAALLFGAGWVSNGWRLSGQHAQELAKRDREALAMAEAVKQIGIETNNTISAADAAAWKGLEDDKKELDRLRGCVAAGTCGVRLITKYVRDGSSDSGASGMGDDTIALDPDVQRRVLDHREAISADQRKIAYLQSYAVQCWRGSNLSQPNDSW